MNEGKKFEKDFKDSMPKSVWCYRFRDGTASWNQDQENVRFQQTNICDFLVYANKLWLLELKTTAGSSLPYSSLKSQRLKKSKLKQQIEMLETAGQHSGIVPGLVVNFRKFQKTYFVHIDKIIHYLETEDRKSIAYKWFEENGILIPQHRKKVNFTYELSDLFNII